MALALLEAAQAGPADVKTLAMRACVGFAVARYSASRLLAAGRLTADRTRRPWVLRIADATADGPHAAEFAFAHLARWSRSPPGGDAERVLQELLRSLDSPRHR